MDVTVVLAQITLGAVLGIAGQSARVVVGLKKLLDEANVQGVTFKDRFSPSVLAVSLLIGAVAGILAVMAGSGVDSSVTTHQSMLAIMAAGYAGTDFIEGFMRNAGTPIKAPAVPDGVAGVALLRRRQTFSGKGGAVAYAITAQLRGEKRPTDNFDKKMGDDLKYDFDTIRGFLKGVSRSLASGAPKYFFQFDDQFAKDALDLTIGELTGAIDSKTLDTQPPGWVNP